MYDFEPTENNGRLEGGQEYDEYADEPRPDLTWTGIVPEDSGLRGDVNDDQIGNLDVGVEGARDAAGFAQTDLYDRVRNLGMPRDEAVVIGSGAVEVIVGPDVRRAQDIDLTVSQGVYNYYREQPGMEEHVMPDGHGRLVGNGLDMGTAWHGKSLEELRAGGYSHEGVAIAGLPDVYEYKQQRGQEKDIHDMQLIRDRLYGGDPLPLGVLGRELVFIKDSIPEHLHARPELHVAANGLYIVRTLFGDESAAVRGYSGAVEKGYVPATYHAWEHTAFGVREGQRSIDAIEAHRRREGLPPAFDDCDRLAAMAGYANHDVILGHGRQAANPTAHDERQSADMAVRHLEAVGVTDSELLEKTHAAIMATTFSEAKKAQDIDPARGHLGVQEIAAGSDLSAFRRSDAPLGAVRLSVEDLSRTGAGYDMPLQRLVGELNKQRPAGEAPIRIVSTEAGLRLIDQHPDYPVTRRRPDGNLEQMSLRQAFAAHLKGSGGFMAQYRFPKSWAVGEPGRQEQNASFMERLAGEVEAGALSATEALVRAKQYHSGSMSD